ASIPLRGQFVVDVGANVGELSELFWRGGAARVLSVEPLHENVERLRRRIAQLGATNWEVEACAVTGADGPAQLRVSREGGGIDNCVVVRGQGDRTVPGRRLSALAPAAEVVKLDVEGHEYAILDEALARMERVHTWALELHMAPGRPLERTLTALSQQGFRLRAAGRRPGDPSGAWQGFEIPPSLSWDRIPVAHTRADGSVFKMVHVLAQRAGAGA
ncbi:MAG TPA: FkbM family methyltransferase, partial [Nannocystis sp.]